ncbi:uncharacterized protein LOC103718115 [Phoenix dactylifera]|uniref:Uncharacterized protein LOC103718115 n=1 Tax=Phoenix dactylifera TaxID=42345 RepID=A0A8B8JAG6_PHODC|nr:uncharacterized protein LOC103718115 [Phoenix dactylifera]XP_017700949.2 uncharacterized protein LOC103718115 [Phoenix dactylifera]XP_026664657.2 uncharacterized protein LOC103718115 [Phoenix dactylifera]
MITNTLIIMRSGRRRRTEQWMYRNHKKKEKKELAYKMGPTSIAGRVSPSSPHIFLSLPVPPRVPVLSIPCFHADRHSDLRRFFSSCNLSFDLKEGKMLCSRSSSNWLDRLHTSKGFCIPAADHDLDHFLSSIPNPNPNTNPKSCSPPRPETWTSDAPLSQPPAEKPAAPRRRRKQQQQQQPQYAAGNKTFAGEKEQLFDLMSSALAELFIMGDRSATGILRASKKSARKQANPKACVPSASASIDGSFLAGAAAACHVPPVTSPSSADNSVAEAKNSRTKARGKRGTTGSPVESDLSTYSKTDATVIDTSSPGWKSEKLIFRKGMVWKVRDKNLWNVCRKKRKLGLVERLIDEK